MQLVARNTSDQACEMQFPSGRGGTVRVFRDGEIVWEHGRCKVYTDHLEIQTWAPGRSESWRFGWNQNESAKTESGRLSCKGERTPAPAGSYTARGVFFGSDPDEKTAPESFRIAD